MKKIIDPAKNTILYKFTKKHIVDWKRKRRYPKHFVWYGMIFLPIILFVTLIFCGVFIRIVAQALQFWEQVIIMVAAYIVLIYIMIDSFMGFYKKARFVQHYFTREVLIDGFEVVFTLVFEDGSEQVLVFNVADLKLKVLSTKNDADYFLTFTTKAKDQMHILHRDDANGWYREDIKEIHREIKKRIKLARNLPPPK